MEENKLLTEENYNRWKKKILNISRIILICGILIGGGLITLGVIKINEVKKDNAVEVNVEDSSEEEIQSKIDALNNELAKLKADQNIEIKENGFSEKYYLLKNEIDKKEKEVNDLEFQLTESKMGFDSVYSSVQTEIDIDKYIPLIAFGVLIILASCIASFILYLTTKRREIAAFTTQQTIPVKQEEIATMTPTIANAAGTVAHDVAEAVTSGIKEGLQDTEEKSE